MTDYQIVGKRLPRADSRARVTGELVYGMDFTLPGMLHGKVFRSTEAHAHILSVDTSRAKALPGVRAVLTAADVPAVYLPDYVHDLPTLARDKVRYIGEPIALVAATTPEIAEQALGLIEVEYRPLPVLTDPEAAMRPDAPLVHEGWASYRAARVLERDGNIACHAALQKGDTARAFADADHIVEERFTTPSVHQVHMEPRVAVATVERGGRVTVYCNTQLPFWIRTNVAAALAVPESQVRIVVTGIGGAFGAKCQPSVEHFSALLAKATGRPVRMALTVREELTDGHPRHPATIELRTALTADGIIIAREARAVLDTGAYAGAGPSLASLAAMVLGGTYRIPNLQIDAYAVYTNKLSFGAFRAPGGPQANFAVESHMDTIAARLGMDPVQLRLQNIVEEGDEGPTGQRLEGVGLRDCVEKVVAAIEWDKPAGPNRGKGLACGWWITTGGPSGCYAKLDLDGTIVVHLGAPEMGTGAVTQGAAQVWAEAMGVDVEDIVIISADTDTTPYDAGSAGSRTVFNLGNASLRTAEDLKSQLLSLASELLEVDPRELEVAAKSVRVKGSPERAISLARLARESNFEKGGLLARGTYLRADTPYDHAMAHSCLHPTFDTPTFHCHAAEVEVDPVTGQLRVLRYVAAHDVGFALNPVGVEGQIHGGVAQGIGMALMEELVFDGGRVVNPNLTDYKIPTIADVPPIQAIVVEHPGPEGPFGAKGVGESPVLEPPAALANAIHNAIGIRIRELPITPEKILRALYATRNDKDAQEAHVTR